MALHSRLGCSEGRLSSVLMLVDVSVDVSVVSVVSVGLQTAKKKRKRWSRWLGGLKPKPDLCRVLAPAASGVATPAAPDT